MLEMDVRKHLPDLEVHAQLSMGPEPGVLALHGPSGAGKTTIVNMVAGLVRPDWGRIVLGDMVLFDGAKGINLPPEKRRVGYVFQEGRLFPHLSVLGNLKYGHRASKPHLRRIELEQVVELLGIGHLLKRRPARLSGGEKQRVAIGRALLANPRLLLMDEPLSSLDQARKDEVLPFIARLTTELCMPILYVSHQVEEIRRLAADVAMIREGRITSLLSAGEFARPAPAPRPVGDEELRLA